MGPPYGHQGAHQQVRDPAPRSGALKAITTVAPFAMPSAAAILSGATEALTRVIRSAVLTERG